MNYDDEDDDDDDDEIEEDAAIAAPRRDDSRAPEVDRDDVDADPSPISVIGPPVRRSVGFSADPPKRARRRRRRRAAAAGAGAPSSFHRAGPTTARALRGR